MTKEEFLIKVQTKFPDTTFVDGPPRATDSKDTSYVKVGLGGVILEGEEYPVFATHEKAAWEVWWESFTTLAKGSTEIHVRRYPSKIEEDYEEIERFLYSNPTIVTKKRYNIIGRFSFYT